MPGRGKGFVDVYDTGGHLLHRVASGGALNAPSGVALAPAGFGSLGANLLIANSGDGHIVAHDPSHHFAFRGRLRGANRRPVTIPCLKALQFGNGVSSEMDPQQMLFINQLHLFTVMTLTGKVQLIEKDGDKQVVVQEGKPAKTESCTDTERKKIQDQIMAYVSTSPPAAPDCHNRSRSEGSSALPWRSHRPCLPGPRTRHYQWWC